MFCGQCEHTKGMIKNLYICTLKKYLDYTLKKIVIEIFLIF